MKVSDFSERLGAVARERGLLAVPLSIGSKQRTYFKIVHGLVFMQVSEMSGQRATASWWIGCSFAWGYVPPGVSTKAYRRVPSVLLLEERRRIIGPEDVSAEGFDYWWKGFNEASLDSLANAIRATEERFLREAPIAELRKCSYFVERRAQIQAVLDGVPMEVPSLESLSGDLDLSGWYSSAARVAKESQRRPPPAFIRELAEDSLLCGAVDLVKKSGS